MLPRIVLLLFAVLAVQADIRECVCNSADPDIQTTRACSLCVEAEKHPVTEKFIVLKDNDATKPNRWLVMPRAKFDGANPLAQMSDAERLALWNRSIAKGRELWGNGWAVAMNGDIARRQCHAHVHVGKLLEDKETADGIFIDGPAQLPVIADGTGLWFHPAGARLHVHVGEQINETVLMR